MRADREGRCRDRGGAVGKRLRGADERGTVVELDSAGRCGAAADRRDGGGKGDRTAVSRRGRTGREGDRRHRCRLVHRERDHGSARARAGQVIRVAGIAGGDRRVAADGEGRRGEYRRARGTERGGAEDRGTSAECHEAGRHCPAGHPRDDGREGGCRAVDGCRGRGDGRRGGGLGNRLRDGGARARRVVGVATVDGDDRADAGSERGRREGRRPGGGSGGHGEIHGAAQGDTIARHGVVVERHRAGRGGRESGGEGDAAAMHGRRGGGGKRGRGRDPADGLGEGGARGDEIACVSRVPRGDRMTSGRQGGRCQGGRAIDKRHQPAEGDAVVEELDRAGRHHARAGGEDRGGEGDAVAKRRRIRGANDTRRGCCLVDHLEDRSTCSGNVVRVVAEIGSRDRETADGERRGGHRRGAVDERLRRAERGRADIELHRAGRPGAAADGGEGGGEGDGGPVGRGIGGIRDQRRARHLRDGVRDAGTRGRFIAHAVARIESGDRVAAASERGDRQRCGAVGEGLRSADRGCAVVELNGAGHRHADDGRRQRGYEGDSAAVG